MKLLGEVFRDCIGICVNEELLERKVAAPV
jgi:hypothetical protein